ncbi:MAG TPA: 5'-nucleotidase domain-containing protein, partial [Myxococcaceae bacterium]|nr:5'-nucleotidase domain-containing protein [Myxococcaceae bacterium]
MKEDQVRSIARSGGSPPAASDASTSPHTDPRGVQRASALEAEQRALEVLADRDLSKLLATPKERREIERARQIFVNRNLRMNKIELIGFDMDYTLAIYHMRRIEQLSFEMTLKR